MKSIMCATQVMKNTQKVNGVFMTIRNLCNVVENKIKFPSQKVITVKNMNSHIRRMEYPIKGSLFLRAAEIEKELNAGIKKSFKTVIKTHMADCHTMGQVPITFVREVITCVSYPELMIQNNIFPEDVKDRATRILSACVGNSIGSYSADIGYEAVRHSVAEFIEKRDGFKANSDNIYLTPGVSVGIKNCLQLLTNTIDNKKSGIMLPTPHSPLYSASIAENDLKQVDYFLDECKDWQITQEELERSYEEGCKDCKIRALVVINPGNPSGQVLTRKNIETIIKFAQRKSLCIFADEVYQHNIYKGEFSSFKKILMELGEPYNQMELVSFMSTSYGYTGEVGIRGGWMEIMNMDPGVQYNLFKLISARLCSSTLGQVVIDCIAKPPIKGEPSYDLYFQETSSILQLLKDRAKEVVHSFNKIEGYSCNTIQGGLYAYPRIELTHKAIKAAEKARQKPDEFYALKLLEETGICVLPGSAFGQKSDTYHFRITILPHPELKKRNLVKILQDFQQKFNAKYS